MPRSASLACRTVCAPTTDRRLPRAGRAVIKAGVIPERIAPGKPQQNGRLERLHLTLLQDTANPPARSLREQLERFRAFQRLYNEERPHQALGNATPAEHYIVSPRRFDGVLRAPDYGDDHAVRRARTNGEIKWQGNTIYISEALAGEPVGLLEDEGGDFAAYYGPIVLGVIAHGGDRLRKPKRRARGLVDNAARCPQAQPQQQNS
jgi:putative transposase